MFQVYNPGCALHLYKPHYINEIMASLNKVNPDVGLHTVCCRHDSKLARGTQIINSCAGCDKRFGSLYEGITTVSLWEVLANSNSFQFPDYHGLEMTIHDACPVRTNPHVHDAIRILLQKMNITVIEAAHSRSKSLCCGDDSYPSLPVDQVVNQMKKRADSMPCEDVCVYCVSCIKSMHIGGKKPRYILDLLFQETTEPQEYDTAKWHTQLQDFIDTH